MEFISIKKDIIKPSSPSSLKKIPLLGMDKAMPTIYVRFLLHFSTCSVSSHELKESLSLTLSLFPPLAGRYTYTEEHTLAVACSDAGVEFHEALADVSIENLPGYPYSMDSSVLQRLSPCDSTPAPECDITVIPLMLVQLTRCRSERCSLAIAIHHNVCDGQAMCLFIRAWARVHTGKKHLVRPPCLDRIRLDPVHVTPGRLCVTNVPDFAAQTLRFTQGEIDGLKGVAGISPVTRFEVVVAEIWRSVVETRKLDRLKMSSLYIAVDGRTRLPCVPDDYFGNVIFMAKVSCRVEQLMVSLGSAVKMVQDAKSVVDDDYMRNVMNLVEDPHPFEKLFPELDLCSDLVVTSWTRFPLYEADFGWGRPVFVGSVGAPGQVILLPVDLNNDIHVVMQLPTW